MSYLVSPASLVNPTDISNAKSFTEAAAQMPPPYDPNEEYRRLLETVASNQEGRPLGKKGFPTGSQLDGYQYLMSKERRVLDTVDRVVNDSLTKNEEGSTLLSLSVQALVMRTAGSLKALLDDLVVSRSTEDIIKALTDPHRLPYIGIALVAIGVMIGMLELAAI